eukprot:9309602-Heterocapsa_arctica.AAC.1
MELQAMRRELQEGQDLALSLREQQGNEIQQLRAQLYEVSRQAHEQNRFAADARREAETVRQQAKVERDLLQANAHDLASTMRHSADAET